MRENEQVVQVPTAGTCRSGFPATFTPLSGGLRRQNPCFDARSAVSRLKMAGGDTPTALPQGSMSTNDDDGNQSDDATCPTCGRDDFASTRGMRRHHAIAHDEPIRETSVCEWCGETYTVGAYRKGSTRCCSHECKNKLVGSEQTGEDHPRYNTAELTCEQCGAAFESQRSNGRRFCSRGCVDTWKDGRNTGTDHPRYERVKVECLNCDTVISVQPCNSDRRFCSRQCRGSYYSQDRNPHWEGGHYKYGPGWTPKKKEAVRERDGRECQHCGRSETDHIEAFGRKHHVHHIVPARQFADDDPAANDMDNLVTLCQGECHRYWEKMAPLRPVTDD